MSREIFFTVLFVSLTCLTLGKAVAQSHPTVMRPIPEERAVHSSDEAALVPITLDTFPRVGFVRVDGVTFDSSGFPKSFSGSAALYTRSK